MNRLNDVPRVTQLPKGRVGIWIQTNGPAKPQFSAGLSSLMFLKHIVYFAETTVCHNGLQTNTHMLWARQFLFIKISG